MRYGYCVLMEFDSAINSFTKLYSFQTGYLKRFNWRVCEFESYYLLFCLLKVLSFQPRKIFHHWKDCCLLVASVSQGRICSDNFTCCHTEIEVADQTFYLTQSQYTDTGPTSPSADPITPGAWQGSHWSANF